MKKISIRALFLLIVVSTGLFITPPLQSVHASTLVVNTLLDEADSSCTDGDCSLRDAISNASANDTISFSVNGTITLTMGQLTIDKNLTIAGPGAALLTVSGGNASRVFFINNLTAVVSISRITIANGLVVDENGGGIRNSGILLLDRVIVDHNSANANGFVFASGGGIFNLNVLDIINSQVTNNQANFSGGGINSDTSSNISLSNVIISGNHLTGNGVGNNLGAGIAVTGNNASSVIMDKVRITSNTAKNAAGLYLSNVASLQMNNSLIDSNLAEDAAGGAWFVSSSGTFSVQNSTISGNQQTVSSTGMAGGLLMDGTLTANLSHVTITGNSVIGTGGGAGLVAINSAIVNVKNSIIAGNTSLNSNDEDCFGTVISQDYNLIQDANGSCILAGPVTNNITGQDPLLNPLAGNGGTTPTHSLQATSPALNKIPNTTSGCGTTFTSDQREVARPQEGLCDMGAYELKPSASIDVNIGGINQGTYVLAPGNGQRVNYAGLDGGPVVVGSTNGVDIISAIRDAWQVNGVTTSFAQLMGLPSSQVSDTYVFPAYNNVTLNEQLRIGNVDTVATQVTVTIGGVLQGTYDLDPDEAVRINYPGLDSGPVIVEGTDGVDIISAIREAWAVNGQTTSFVQLMGLPASQLSNKYVFPAYNNVTLNEQLRIGNVDSAPSTVTVTIGGILQGTYDLDPDEAVRINYAGLDDGPVIVEGTAGVDIIAAIRDAWQVNGVTTSFAQLMGMPAGSLSDTYIFPAYNNVTLNEQLRIGNVDSVLSTVTVTVGGTLQGTYELDPNEAVRINYAGLDGGPVVVQGTAGVKIISAIREAWAVNGSTTSFVQFMGLPFEQLSTTYLFPAYNNITLNEQLRFAVP